MNWKIETPKMPVLFVGHGSPMNAIEENEFSRAWITTGQALPRPQAILCISAHWQTAGVQVTAMAQPRTIYDFYGFPRPLYEKSYPAPGAPDLARHIQTLLTDVGIGLDLTWGLDHGTWSVLSRMYPAADIPVIQLSLDDHRTPAEHYALGKALNPLRRQGVLIVGSGNMVHNLGVMRWMDEAFDWAEEFDTRLAGWIEAGDHQSIIDYPKAGRIAQLSIPTNEHYLPMLYILALQEADETAQFFAARVTYGSISMRSFRFG